MSVRIGIIGAGHVGEALAQSFVRRGYPVRVANSRGRDTLEAFAERTGAEAVDIGEASSQVDVLFLAIPLGRVPELPKALFDGLADEAIVVDAGNYYPSRDGAIAAIDQGLPEAVWVARQLGTDVVKAFNSIIASRLVSEGRPPGARRRIALPVAGGDPKARAAIMELVEAIGFAAYDAGPAEDSWRQQAGQPAYCTDPTLSELPRLLQRADRRKAARGRDEARQILSRLPDDYPAEQLVKASRFSVGLDRYDPASWLAMLRLALALMSRRR